MDDIATNINTILKNIIKNFNTFLDCPVRFGGDYDDQKVQNFIEYIEYYKRVKCIGDEQALEELQYLLFDQARFWWLRRKSDLNTWSEALTLLENQYSKRRPAHVVYTEILKHHYSIYESTDDFIDDKIELFDELSLPKFKENNKMEIIYALLPNEVQQKVKLVNINSIQELKEELKVINVDNVELRSPTNSFIKANSTLQQNILTKMQESGDACDKESSRQEPNCNNVNAIAEAERDPIIIVRREEDLIPSDIKDEERTCTAQEVFICTNTEMPKSYLAESNQTFQIDNDIMNQIINIIDESEMNNSPLNNKQVGSDSLNNVSSLECLGFHANGTTQSEVVASSIPKCDTKKSAINGTKNLKIRCCYCRSRNHKSQICFKKARQMKQFPERFGITKPSNLSSKKIGESLESMPASTRISTTKTTTINSNSTSREPTTSFSIQQTATTSMSYTSLTANSPVTSSSIVLNNTSEKSTYPALTTKLIAPINGKTHNKIMAAKLHINNKTSPKCHQCGRVGFYKSICPNCSPIYNSNNHHNQHK